MISANTEKAHLTLEVKLDTVNVIAVNGLINYTFDVITHDIIIVIVSSICTALHVFGMKSYAANLGMGMIKFREKKTSLHISVMEIVHAEGYPRINANFFEALYHYLIVIDAQNLKNMIHSFTCGCTRIIHGASFLGFRKKLFKLTRACFCWMKGCAGGINIYKIVSYLCAFKFFCEILYILNSSAAHVSAL